MIIQFQIVKSIIIEAVKAATYLKGKVDEASAQPGQRTPYFETAGDDEVHERTLDRDYTTALEKVKTIFVDYLVPTAQTIGDNVIYYQSNDNDVVVFTLNVSRRYNGALTDTLARLTAKYVEDYMCYQWWLKISNLNQAAPYQAALTVDESDIRRCFVLSGPVVPKLSFPVSITAKVNGSDIADDDGEITVRMCEDNSLSFSINDGAIDDIEARSSNPSVVELARDIHKHTFSIITHNRGVADVLLFSRHNEEATATVTIIVTDN